MALPVITSNGGGPTARILIQEGVTAISTVLATGTAPITYTVSAGADAAKVSLHPDTGDLDFVGNTNWEIPDDADGNRIYDITVTATNGEGADSQVISVLLTNNPADDPAPPPHARIALGVGIGV